LLQRKWLILVSILSLACDVVNLKVMISEQGRIGSVRNDVLSV